MPGQVISLIPRITNSGDSCYVRVSVKYEDGNNIERTLAPNNIENSSEEWVRQGDYWYYKNVLPVGEDTAPMSIDWQIIQLPVDLSGKRVRTDVRVVLEYAQTTHDMWKELFQINDLPTGVERVQE